MTTNTYFTVVNNANSACQGQFKTREQAEVLADNLQEQAITEHHNHQIIYSVEQIEMNEPTNDKDRLIAALWDFANDPDYEDDFTGIESALGRTIDVYEKNAVKDFRFMAGSSDYDQDDLDIETERIANTFLAAI